MDPDLTFFHSFFHLCRAAVPWHWKQGMAQSKQKKQNAVPAYRLSFTAAWCEQSSADIPMEERGFSHAENRSLLRWRSGSCFTLGQPWQYSFPSPTFCDCMRNGNERLCLTKVAQVEWEDGGISSLLVCVPLKTSPSCVFVLVPFILWSEN